LGYLNIIGKKLAMLHFEVGLLYISENCISENCISDSAFAKCDGKHLNCRMIESSFIVSLNGHQFSKHLKRKEIEKTSKENSNTEIIRVIVK